LGTILLTNGMVKGDEDTLAGAWDKFAADAAANPTTVCVPNVDPTKVVLCKDFVTLVQQGIEPSTMQNVCGPTYGCGATVAQRPLADSQANRDPAPAVAAALAAIAGLFAMRRRRR
jgi:MYXO-CTERM domain-containing protein